MNCREFKAEIKNHEILIQPKNKKPYTCYIIEITYTNREINNNEMLIADKK